jgi:hypothetical protein
VAPVSRRSGGFPRLGQRAPSRRRCVKYITPVESVDPPGCGLIGKGRTEVKRAMKPLGGLAQVVARQPLPSAKMLTRG